MDNKHYNPIPMLSRNARLNLINSYRSGGKTFWAKQYIINQCFKRNKTFLLVRRYDSDLNLQVQTFVNDIAAAGAIHIYLEDWKASGHQFIYQGQPLGYYYALTSSQKIKSAALYDTDYILFDEYLADTRLSRYITDEPSIFEDVLFSVFRERPNCRAFCLGNMLSKSNPYFEHYNIDFPEPGKFWFDKKRSVLCEHYVNYEHMAEIANNTMIGNLISGTAYGNYALQGEFLLDTIQDTREMPKNAICSIIVRFQGLTFGIWYELGEYYISKKYQPNARHKVAHKVSDCKNGFILATEARKEMWYRNYRTAAFRGHLHCIDFETGKLLETYADYI